ncbi:MAG: polysaccharide deacetylase family protein [Cyclobacteriaceae bacterium]
MIPHQTPFFLPFLYSSLTWRIGTEKKELYLTFDDGPVSGPTDFVLDQLSQSSVKATFFCIGDNIRKYPSVFTRIINDGHTVGNHTVNHLNGWKTTTEDYVENVHEFQEIISAAGYKQKCHLFRPPYGRITRKEIKALSAYHIIMWDVLSQDYDRGLSPEECLKGTLNACRPGSIIVFHDSYKSEKNMKYALPRLIDFYRDKGYTFKAI